LFIAIGATRISLFLSLLSEPIRLVTVHAPPTYYKSLVRERFFDALKECTLSHNWVIVTGDFNTKEREIGVNKITDDNNRLLEKVVRGISGGVALNKKLKVSAASFVSKQGRSTVDDCLISDQVYSQFCSWEILDHLDTLSDHAGTLLRFKFRPNREATNNNPPPKEILDWKKLEGLDFDEINLEKHFATLKADIDALQFIQDKSELAKQKTTDQITKAFIGNLRNALREEVGFKLIKHSYGKTKEVPGVRKLCDKIQKLWRKAIGEKDVTIYQNLMSRRQVF